LTGGAARAWLEEQLHFDVLAFDDWLGGVVLVAPDPLLRRHGARLLPGQNGETVEATCTPRRGVVLSGLQVVFQERRAEGWGLRVAAPLDPLNSARLAVPGLVGELGQQIVCPVRGLLHDDPPGHFFRSVSVRAEHTVGQRASQPLPRGQQAVPRPYLTTVRKAAPPPTSSDFANSAPRPPSTAS
jgi:hypothetical protein